jgi:hypothetical protein
MNKTADKKAWNKDYYIKHRDYLRAKSYKKRQTESARIKELKQAVIDRWNAKLGE